MGSGRAFAMIGDWTPDGGRVFMRWAYYGDFLMIFLTKNPIPSDLETIHRARGMYLEFRSARSYLFSIMDFAEKFGANTDSVGLMVIEADLSHEDSVAHYIALDFEKALERLESSIGQLRKASERAMKLKDQAMAWIYFIEWATVTSTFAIGIFGVWTLMIRRRYYRDVARTRFGR